MAVNWGPAWAAREIIKQNKNLKLTYPPAPKVHIVLFYSSYLGSCQLPDEPHRNFSVTYPLYVAQGFSFSVGF